MKNKKTILKKLLAVAFILAAAFLLNPAGVQAAKKPGKVTNLEEVKATDTSITVKFKKVKGAKKYQVRVYEAKKNRLTKKWDAPKKLVKKIETKKTTCTVKGLEWLHGYAIKVRACNGKAYGKWTTLKTLTAYNSDGVKLPGTTAATGKYLENQYKKWKKYILKEMESNIDSMYVPIDDVRCIETVRDDRKDYASYSKDELLRTYKNGTGSNLEIYHMIDDICKSAGVKCAIRKCVYESTVTYDFLSRRGDEIESTYLKKGGGTGTGPETLNELEDEILKKLGFK